MPLCQHPARADIGNGAEVALRRAQHQPSAMRTCRKSVTVACSTSVRGADTSSCALQAPVLCSLSAQRQKGLSPRGAEREGDKNGEGGERPVRPGPLGSIWP
jgi:hypothetical protein